MPKPVALPPIIDCSWLQKQLQRNAGPKLIDVRAETLYRQSHIPGAAHFDLEQVNSQHPPVRGLLPALDEFNEAMSASGLDKSDQIIVYDDSGGPAAARMVWVLKAFGHMSAALLNGGFKYWTSQAGATDGNIPEIEFSDYRADPDNRRIADRDYIKKRLHQTDIVLLDNRTPAEYAGQDLRAARGGHIPGAVNYDWINSKQPGSTLFKPRDVLKQEMESLGISSAGQEIICYCQSHQRSCVICLLLEDLGYSNVKGYPGAWSDWGNTMDTPIE